MANTPSQPIPFNPMLFWSDFALRAADMAMASAQNLGDGMDRLARAGAVQPALFLGTTPAAAPEEPAEADEPPNPAVLWQTLAIEIMDRGWQQWFAGWRTLWSLGAGGRALGLPVPAGPDAAWTPATDRVRLPRSGTRQAAAEDTPARGALEHAAAGREKRSGSRRRPRSGPAAGR